MFRLTFVNATNQLREILEGLGLVLCTVRIGPSQGVKFGLPASL